MNQREEILSLFDGQKPKRPPCFSGLISVTSAGLGDAGLKFHEVHTDTGKMARTTASTFRLTGFPSTVVPLDLCVEAEAIGAELNFQADSHHPIFPSPTKFIFGNCETASLQNADEGRIPLVCDSIRLLKTEVGDEAVIGAFVPGPYTLLSLLVKPEALMLDLKHNPASVHAALDAMADMVIHSALAYRQAGADMLTVHEMGGSPGVLGPKRFETFVLPVLHKVLTSLPRPRVLSVCGNTNTAMPLLAQAGADAISVDQLNDLIASRKALQDTLLFGNIDPVGVLAKGSPSEVRQAVASAVAAGVDAIWPGCDLYPLTPVENLKTMVSMAQNL